MQTVYSAALTQTAPARIIWGAFAGIIVSALMLVVYPASAQAQAASSLLYTFNSPGTLYQAPSPAQSTSPYFWLAAGGALMIDGAHGNTLQGALDATNPLYESSKAHPTTQTDGGTHPQNNFLLLTKATGKNIVVENYFDRIRDNLAAAANQHPYNAESLVARYQDDGTYYLGSIRADGYAIIKKKIGGAYYTLAAKKIFPGTYGAQGDYNIIPLGRWIGLKFAVIDTDTGPQLSLYTDYGWSGAWKLAVTALDDGSNAAAIEDAGTAGITTDYADFSFDNFAFLNFDATQPTTRSTQASPAAAPGYDDVVLADKPVLFLGMSTPASRAEHDLSGNGHSGTYQGGTPSTIALPNGDNAARFNGNGEYLSVPSSPELSIAHTGALTWEGWVRADTLTFPKATASGYVDWMGKCATYSPSCEWEARWYSTDTTENRPTRFSAYVFNPSAGLGSGADWQPSSGEIAAGQWVYIVAEYQTKTTPSQCPVGAAGTIAIWIDGVQQSFADHAPTGCMSQFQVSPRAGDSPLNIGTMALDSWFPGAVGKVAVYDHLLTQSQIAAHFKAMTGQSPAGSCGITCTLSSALKLL